ncbi:MAG: N-acetylmuramoyl-L-alanine amidase [Chitinophagaceae bacterium]|nr:N-acetylmuramoyl-L-alanine amidase [Chitinophagaceae bacterium]
MHKIILFFLFIFPLTSFSQQSFFFVETKDSLPYLNYGLGKDRLGGAKMTFLDSNVILKVVDSFGTQYKVQLSEQHSAWIEKQNVERTEGEFLPQYISGNWRVEGDSAFDYVAVSLPQRLPYNSRMDIDPAKIVVDIFGVTSNTNWITQMPTTREIKNVWYVQREDDVMEVNIELKHKTQWGYHIYYDSLNRLTIRVNRQPSSLLLRKMIIAVDAGHGGENTGATGVNTGIIEKDYTLLYAEELKKQLLAKKVKVVMTREKDTTLSMFERIRFLQQEQPDLLVSIHFNSASIDTVHGVSTYYRYVGFRPLSQFILKRMMAIGLNDFGNVGSFNFSLSGPTEFPNCLVEVAFLSNPQDEKKIRSVVFRRKVAQQIILGITDFLNSLK